MDAENLPFLTVAEVGKLMKTKQISPVELTQTYLKRIGEVDPKLCSYITVCADEALKAARRAQKEIARGQYIGPLHGVPVAVKDQLWSKGVRTTGGSKVLGDFIPKEDATAIRKLKEAGAILLGKLNLSELAIGGTRVHPYGTPRNPWDLEYTAGESSSGSGIAVAAYLCSAALGEDTGGSIRYPASSCGIVGLRPSPGRVSRYGIMPLSWSMDTAGPMTHTVKDCALVLQAIAGYDPQDGTSRNIPVPNFSRQLGKGVKGMRIGVIREFLDKDGNHPEVQTAAEKAIKVFRGLGARVEEISLPLVNFVSPIFVGTADVDFASVLENILRTRAVELDSNTRTRAQAAFLVPAYLHQKAQRARNLLRQQVMEGLKKMEVLISPTMPDPPRKIESFMARFESKESVQKRMYRTRSYMCTNPLAGIPAISVPCGFTANHLPIGLQIAGKPFDESTILWVAAAFESATDYHLRRPPI